MKPERLNKFLFKEALSLLEPESVIVELGTIRDSNPKAEKTDGWSTLQWLRDEGRHSVTSIDKNRKAVSICKGVVYREFPELENAFVTRFWPINQEAEHFLQFLPHNVNKHYLLPISLLYMDAPVGQDAVDCLETAFPLMSKKSLVLIDDIDGTDRGELLPPLLLREGYELGPNNSRQQLWVKNEKRSKNSSREADTV